MDDPASSEGTRSGVAHLVGWAKAVKKRTPRGQRDKPCLDKGIEPKTPSRTARKPLGLAEALNKSPPRGQRDPQPLGGRP